MGNKSDAAPDVFLSYAHENKDIAERMVIALEANGFRVFWDKKNTLW